VRAGYNVRDGNNALSTPLPGVRTPSAQTANVTPLDGAHVTVVGFAYQGRGNAPIIRSCPFGIDTSCGLAVTSAATCHVGGTVTVTVEPDALRTCRNTTTPGENVSPPAVAGEYAGESPVGRTS
jgi:hypothetical protein